MSSTNEHQVQQIDLPTEMRRMLERMNKDTQGIAIQILSFEQAAAQDFLLGRYDIGELAQRVIEDEATYGENALAQISEFANIAVPDLKGLAHLTKEIEKETVQKYLAVPTKKGKFLTLTHWIAIAASPEKGRQKLIDRTIREGWSSTDLMNYVRASNSGSRAAGAGRRPIPPKSIQMGVQKYFTMLTRLRSFDPLLEEHVLSRMDDISIDDKPMLSKLQAVFDLVSQELETLQNHKERLGSSLSAINTLINDTPATAEEEAAAEAAPEPTSKPAKKPAKKAAQKPAGKPAKKPAKKASKKPAEELQPA